MFSLASPLAILVLVVVAIATAATIVWLSPYFRRLVNSRGARLSSLDGLRGFLAFGVFIHHATLNHGLLSAIGWSGPNSVLFNYLGSGCVALFFMASGFLFWSRAIDKKVDPERLLISRFWRIMPMYWATMFVVFIVAGSLSNFTLRVDPIVFRREVAFWLMGGYFVIGTINGVSTVNINAGVTWSLLYEWWFYLALPLLAIFATPKRFALGFGLFMAVRYVSLSHVPEYYFPIQHSTGFAFGMLMAHLVRIERLRFWMTRRSVALGALLFLAGCLWYNDTHPLTAISNQVMSLPLFAAVSCGNNFFRVLTRRWALLLGHVSYSVYLAHGLVLYFLVQRVLGAKAVMEMTPVAYWGWVAVFVVPCLVGVSCLTYRFIEAPFLRRASLSGSPSSVRRPAEYG